MAQEGGKQQNTAYGVFVQACWAQHKRQYPDELTKKSRSSTNNVLSGGTIFQNKKESVSRRWQIAQMQPTH